MKFNDTLTQYLSEANISVKTEKKDTFNDETINLLDFLLEARKAKADLYKDLSIRNTNSNITSQDVTNIKFYHRGKSVKDSLQGDELQKANTKQAELFNKIFQAITQSATNNKITLIELTAAAIKVFKEAGQNAPTAGYNLRGLLTVLIKQKRMLEPFTGEPLDTSGVDITPTATDEGPIDASSSEDTAPEEKPKETNITSTDSSTGKFESEVEKNTPESTGEYLKADKNAKVDKTDPDFPSRSERTDANFILNILREHLPGTLTKKTLLDRLREEEDSIGSTEASLLIDKLIKKRLISLVPKSETSEDDTISIQGDADEDNTMSNPEDITDTFYGLKRKGFGSSNSIDFDF